MITPCHRALAGALCKWHHYSATYLKKKKKKIKESKAVLENPRYCFRDPNLRIWTKGLFPYKHKSKTEVLVASCVTGGLPSHSCSPLPSVITWEFFQDHPGVWLCLFYEVQGGAAWKLLHKSHYGKFSFITWNNGYFLVMQLCFPFQIVGGNHHWGTIAQAILIFFIKGYKNIQKDK